MNMIDAKEIFILERRVQYLRDPRRGSKNPKNNDSLATEFLEVSTHADFLDYLEEHVGKRVWVELKNPYMLSKPAKKKKTVALSS